MRYAVPTPTRVIYVPIRDLSVEHTHRCLIRHQGRITESPVVVHVKYPADMPIRLWIVLTPDDEANYVDENGWMFSDTVIEKLVRKRKLRYAT